MNNETYSNVEELLLKECKRNEKLRKMYREIIHNQAQEINRLSQKLTSVYEALDKI